MIGEGGASTYVFGLLGLLLVFALAFLASPLIAAAVAVVGAAFMVFGASLFRQSKDGEPGPERATTPEGKPTSPTGSRSSGEPASGEGS